MNILFDCISLQKFIGGGSEYTLFFFNKLLQRARKGKINLFGIYSSKLGMDFYSKYIADYQLELVDIENANLGNFIKQHKINTIFIGIAQRYYNYDLTNTNCRIIIVCHDASELVLLYDKNFTSNTRRKLELIRHPHLQHIKEFIKYFLHYFIEEKYENDIKKKYKRLETLLQKPNVHIITVSNYSKYCLLYYFDNIANHIQVFTPPHKIIPKKIDETIENQELKSLIESGKKYFLLLHCSRFHKNAAIFVEQWDKFCKITNYKYYGVLVGDIAKINKQNIIQLPPLSTTDLEQAYKNAYSFVFASVSEGYGSPPMESMKYGTPVVCSNVTSMPEIYGDAALYFSPYYREDLFKALLCIIEKHDEYREKSIKKYKEIEKKQLTDVKKLENFIFKETNI